MGESTVILSFSARKGGNCDKIGAYIMESLPGETMRYSFSEFAVHPCGGCEYQCFQNNLNCPYIADMEFALLEAICASETAYFVVPNYCDYPCAHFFIFNERSQCFFQHHPEKLDAYLRVPKRFVVVSNTQVENFREVFRQQVNGEPDMLILSAKRFGSVSIRGDLMDSAPARQEIANFLRKGLR